MSTHADLTRRPPYSISPTGPDVWEWHCHLCDDAKACPGGTVWDDAQAHHDLWHTDGATP